MINSSKGMLLFSLAFAVDPMYTVLLMQLAALKLLSIGVYLYMPCCCHAGHVTYYETRLA